MNDIKQVSRMTPRTRELMLRVVDGQDVLLPYMEYFWNWKRCDLMLDWCIRNRLTGKNLATWIKFKWGNDRMGLVKHILMKIDKAEAPRPVFLGEEYRPRR